MSNTVHRRKWGFSRCPKMREKISQLIDSELDEKETAKLLSLLDTEASLKEAWSDYHLIGDALRANRMLHVDVRSAVSVRVYQSPTVVATPYYPSPLRSLRTWGRYALAASVCFIVMTQWQPLTESLRASLQNDQVAKPTLHAVSDRDNVYFFAHQEMAADQNLLPVMPGQRAPS